MKQQPFDQQSRNAEYFKQMVGPALDKFSHGDIYRLFINQGVRERADLFDIQQRNAMVNGLITSMTRDDDGQLIAETVGNSTHALEQWRETKRIVDAFVAMAEAENERRLEGFRKTYGGDRGEK